jgi:hypothetical protein
LERFKAIAAGPHEVKTPAKASKIKRERSFMGKGFKEDRQRLLTAQVPKLQNKKPGAGAPGWGVSVKLTPS